MQRDETVFLGSRPGYASTLWGFIDRFAEGKRVLNVGAAGNVEYYLDGHRNEWLHDHLSGVAAELVGLDIDEESVAFARAHGIDIVSGDCEEAELGGGFDLIVISEVIEHVASPVRAIGNLLSQLGPGGRIVLTTPNPTYYATLVRATLGRPIGVYYDHVDCFLPEHIAVICSRLDARLEEVCFYNTFDSRTSSMKVKSQIAALIGRINPRLASNFIAVIEPDTGSS